MFVFRIVILFICIFSIQDVDERSPAFESGLRPSDLITHINNELIQGMYHTQVVTLLMGSTEHVTLRAVPLDQTSIRTGKL